MILDSIADFRLKERNSHGKNALKEEKRGQATFPKAEE
jgi:hypothetical protein